MLNYSTRYMAIHSAAFLAKSLQTPRPESHFQVGGAQFKAIRGLSQIFGAETKIPNRDAFPAPPPGLLMNKRTKLPRVEEQTATPPRLDLEEESKNREQKPPSIIQATPSSEATRKKYTKNLRN